MPVAPQGPDVLAAGDVEGVVPARAEQGRVQGAAQVGVAADEGDAPAAGRREGVVARPAEEGHVLAVERGQRVGPVAAVEPGVAAVQGQQRVVAVAAVEDDARRAVRGQVVRARRPEEGHAGGAANDESVGPVAAVQDDAAPAVGGQRVVAAGPEEGAVRAGRERVVVPAAQDPLEQADEGERVDVPAGRIDRVDLLHFAVGPPQVEVDDRPVGVAEVDRVGAAADPGFDHHVGRPGDFVVLVVPVAADHGVVALAAVEGVVARPGVEPVVARTAQEEVVARAGQERVVAVPAVEDDGDRQRAGVDEVVTPQAEDDEPADGQPAEVAGHDGDAVVPGRADDHQRGVPAFAEVLVHDADVDDVVAPAVRGVLEHLRARGFGEERQPVLRDRPEVREARGRVGGRGVADEGLHGNDSAVGRAAGGTGDADGRRDVVDGAGCRGRGGPAGSRHPELHSVVAVVVGRVVERPAGRGRHCGPGAGDRPEERDFAGRRGQGVAGDQAQWRAFIDDRRQAENAHRRRDPGRGHVPRLAADRAVALADDQGDPVVPGAVRGELEAVLGGGDFVGQTGERVAVLSRRPLVEEILTRLHGDCGGGRQLHALGAGRRQEALRDGERLERDRDVPGHHRPAAVPVGYGGRDDVGALAGRREGEVRAGPRRDDLAVAGTDRPLDQPAVGGDPRHVLRPGVGDHGRERHGRADGHDVRHAGEVQHRGDVEYDDRRRGQRRQDAPVRRRQADPERDDVVAVVVRGEVERVSVAGLERRAVLEHPPGVDQRVLDDGAVEARGEQQRRALGAARRQSDDARDGDRAGDERGRGGRAGAAGVVGHGEVKRVNAVRRRHERRVGVGEGGDRFAVGEHAPGVRERVVHAGVGDRTREGDRHPGAGLLRHAADRDHRGDVADDDGTGQRRGRRRPLVVGHGQAHVVQAVVPRREIERRRVGLEDDGVRRAALGHGPQEAEGRRRVQIDDVARDDDQCALVDRPGRPRDRHARERGDADLARRAVGRPGGDEDGLEGERRRRVRQADRCRERQETTRVRRAGDLREEDAVGVEIDLDALVRRGLQCTDNGRRAGRSEYRQVRDAVGVGRVVLGRPGRPDIDIGPRVAAGPAEERVVVRAEGVEADRVAATSARVADAAELVARDQVADAGVRPGRVADGVVVRAAVEQNPEAAVARDEVAANPRPDGTPGDDAGHFVRRRQCARRVGAEIVFTDDLVRAGQSKTDAAIPGEKPEPADGKAGDLDALAGHREPGAAGVPRPIEDDLGAERVEVAAEGRLGASVQGDRKAVDVVDRRQVAHRPDTPGVLRGVAADQRAVHVDEVDIVRGELEEDAATSRRSVRVEDRLPQRADPVVGGRRHGEQRDCGGGGVDLREVDVVNAAAVERVRGAARAGVEVGGAVEHAGDGGVPGGVEGQPLRGLSEGAVERGTDRSDRNEVAGGVVSREKPAARGGQRLDARTGVEVGPEGDGPDGRNRAVRGQGHGVRRPADALGGERAAGVVEADQEPAAPAERTAQADARREGEGGAVRPAHENPPGVAGHGEAGLVPAGGPVRPGQGTGRRELPNEGVSAGRTQEVLRLRGGVEVDLGPELPGDDDRPRRVRRRRVRLRATPRVVPSGRPDPHEIARGVELQDERLTPDGGQGSRSRARIEVERPVVLADDQGVSAGVEGQRFRRGGTAGLPGRFGPDEVAGRVELPDEQPGRRRVRTARQGRDARRRVEVGGADQRPREDHVPGRVEDYPADFARTRRVQRADPDERPLRVVLGDEGVPNRAADDVRHARPGVEVETAGEVPRDVTVPGRVGGDGRPVAHAADVGRVAEGRERFRQRQPGVAGQGRPGVGHEVGRLAAGGGADPRVPGRRAVPDGVRVQRVGVQDRQRVPAAGGGHGRADGDVLEGLRVELEQFRDGPEDADFDAVEEAVAVGVAEDGAGDFCGRDRGRLLREEEGVDPHAPDGVRAGAGVEVADAGDEAAREHLPARREGDAVDDAGRGTGGHGHAAELAGRRQPHQERLTVAAGGRRGSGGVAGAGVEVGRAVEVAADQRVAVGGGRDGPRY